MTKIIAIAHELGMEIAASEEIKNLNLAKERYDNDEALLTLMREYEAQRALLAQEFNKSEQDADVITSVKAKLEELSHVIMQNGNYTAFAAAQKAMNDLMAAVNAEIKFCITGERPTACTHDCSTCGGCSGS